jgi:hypothetical protein
VLKWLRENGCPWSENTCVEAIYGGQLDTLEWLVENGCLYDYQRCLEVANLECHDEVVEWIETYMHE